MKNKISIPKPCHENWEAMLPEEKGRHCLSCCKTVVDFSSWDNDSILAYLKQRSTESVCGRFYTNQVEQPATPGQQEPLHQVVRSGMPVVRKIAAIIILCFGLSGFQEASAQKLMGKVAAPKHTVENHTKGEVAIQPATDTTKVIPVPQADTLHPKPVIMGMIAPYHPPKTKKAPPKGKVAQQPKATKTTKEK
jgi:hypothetical protein